MKTCRGCSQNLKSTFLDLGITPIANNLINQKNIHEPEIFYPLHSMVCDNCSLVQLPELVQKEILFSSDYVYYSSYSSSWLDHSKAYANEMVRNLSLVPNDLVIEVASNDGYLLQYFAALGIQVLGIEPAVEVANVSISKGIKTISEFFGAHLAIKLAAGQKPKLIIGNNVLAHVPDLHDFIKGFSILIADDGIITFEFPHLVNLIKNNQFDTIYHEHFSYLSITALKPILEMHGLRIIDVEEIGTHGGSLRVYLAKSHNLPVKTDNLNKIISQEIIYDPRKLDIRSNLQQKVNQIKIELISELIKCKKANKRVIAYGAAAKGNTLLNYSRIDSDLIECVVDLNPSKQGKLLPGSRIPIVGDSILKDNPPDVLFILPWNISEEIKNQLSFLSESGVKYFRAIPNVEYF